VEVNLVDVLFTVFDRRNRLVTDLDKGDFKVFDDNVPQTIDHFTRQSDLPLRIGLLVDTSNSIRERLHFEQDAAVDFLYNVVRRGKDQAFLMTFDDQPYVVQDYTDDVAKVRDEIMGLRAGGATAIYDAIFEAANNQLSHPPRPRGDQPDVVRRVMVLISDGDDVLSDHTKAEAIEMAQRSSVVIYTISTNSDWIGTSSQPDDAAHEHAKYRLTENDEVLKDLAEQTGGRPFFPYHVDDLNQSFLDIGDELRCQYQLDYNPSNYRVGGPYHRIKVEVDRKGLQVRHRKGYFVRSAPVAATKPSG